MELPAELRKTLSEGDFADVESWWASLTPQQQREIGSAEDVRTEEFSPLPKLDSLDPEDDLYPFYEYLTNHELRVVNFVADSEARSAHRIVSSYIATLGSDYRHDRPGTVR